MQKGQLTVGRNHQQAVRLGHAAGYLGQELGPRHADGDRQVDPLAHLAAQPRRHFAGRAGDLLHAAHVQERLVDG